MRKLKKRIDINLNARIILNNRSYTGYTENISEYGLKWYHYSTVKNSLYNNVTEKSILPGTKVKLECKLPSGEKFDMFCKVKWLRRPFGGHIKTSVGIDPQPEYTTLGMEILNPPATYKKFFETLV